MNKVILMGRLTKDPEARYTQGNPEPLCVTKYTLAVDRRGKKREGEQDADFINCKVFGKAGEFAEKFFKKGMLVCVSGRLQISAFDDQQGKRQWYTEVILDDQYFAESKASFESRSQNSQYQGQSQSAPYQSHSDYAPPAQGTQKPRGDVPPDFFVDQELDDDDLPF